MKTLTEKNNFRIIILLTITATLLIFPSKCSSGVKLGIHIALYSLVPAILPFLIFSNYILQSGYSSLIGKLVHPLFKKLFKTSENGSYAAALGFLCGYPLGAKITADLVRTGKISAAEGEYLFTFVNNPSPAFVLCYVSSLTFPDTGAKIKALFLIYLPPLIIGICSRNHDFTGEISSDSRENYLPFSKIIDDSIFNAFTTLAKLTGYIIIFSILASLISDIPGIPDTAGCLIYGALEITSGIYCISTSALPPLIRYLLSVIFSVAGGAAVLFQINSVIQNSSLRLRLYIKYKLICVFLCIIIFLLMAAGIAGTAYL